MQQACQKPRQILWGFKPVVLHKPYCGDRFASFAYPISWNQTLDGFRSNDISIWFEQQLTTALPNLGNAEARDGESSKNVSSELAEVITSSPSDDWKDGLDTQQEFVGPRLVLETAKWVIRKQHLLDGGHEFPEQVLPWRDPHLIYVKWPMAVIGTLIFGVDGPVIIAQVTDRSHGVWILLHFRCPVT